MTYDEAVSYIEDSLSGEGGYNNLFQDEKDAFHQWAIEHKDEYVDSGYDWISAFYDWLEE